MTDILILGDNSSLSNYLVNHLATRGYDFDFLSDKDESISAKGYKNQFHCKRNDENEVKRLLVGKSYSYIFDLSGNSKESIDVLLNSIDSNSLKKYIYCPSSIIYKSGSSADENKVISTNNILDPLDKNIVTVENHIFDLIKSETLKATIFRPGFIYEDIKSIDKDNYFTNRLKDNSTIQLPNDSTTVQFIHVDDVAKNLECAMFNNNDNRAYFLVHPKPYTWKEVVLLIADSLNKTPSIEELPKEEFANNRKFPFIVDSINLDISNLRNNGLHSPMVHLDEIIK